jgi:tripartite-type tricarboxylate transporter receptor subunit TctC
MNRLWIPTLALAVAAMVVATTACSGAAPAAPTTSPAPKAAEPTKPAAAAPAATTAPAPAAPTAAPAAPTAVPAKKVDYPVKGKTISLVCTLPAGGAADLSARVLASMLEKELGVPVQVENKTGAGGQVALTELQNAKPDGYLISMANLPSLVTMPADPDRQTAWTRKDFIQLAFDTTEPVVLVVRSDSPWKTTKDVVDGLKAKPGQYSASVSGVLASPHLGGLLFMKETGTQFKPVNFEGGPQSLQALLGGHTDLQFEFYGSLSGAEKAGQIRLISVEDSTRYKLLPNVPTMTEQGYNVVMTTYRGYAVPKNTPPEIVDILDKAIKKINTSPEFIQKLTEIGTEVRPLDAKGAAAYLDSQEATIKAVFEMAKAQTK